MTTKTRKSCIERWKISTRSIGADHFELVMQPAYWTASKLYYPAYSEIGPTITCGSQTPIDVVTSAARFRKNMKRILRKLGLREGQSWSTCGYDLQNILSIARESM